MHRHLRFVALVAGSAAGLMGLADFVRGQGAGARAVATAADSTNGLAPLRANQAMSMNALLGFINAEPVFASDMLRPIDETLRELAKPANSRNVSEFRDQARTMIESQLKQYVSDMLVMTNAKSSLTEEDKEKLDLFMNLERAKLVSKHGGSEALANQALKAEGSSVDKALRDTRRQVTVDFFLNKRLYPKIVITRQTVLDDYEKSPQKWQQGAEIELYTITLPVSRWLPKAGGGGGMLGVPIADPTPEQTRQAEVEAIHAAHEVIDRLNKGANFAQLVEDYHSHDLAATTGGGTPHVKKGSLANEKIEQYAFSLSANTVGSEPQLVDDSDPAKKAVMIIKVGDKKEMRTVSFAEAQRQIYEEEWNKQRQQLFTEYRQTLLNAAAIEPRLERMLDIAVDVAVARYATQ